MKKSGILMILMTVGILTTAFSPIGDKLVSSETHIKFFSTTPVEDIEANNFKSVSTFNQATGELVFSVPMQSFEFEKSKMQKHFNSDKFLDTKSNPKATLKATLSNPEKVDFNKAGVYSALVSGNLTINGVTKAINENVTFEVKGNEIILNSKFNITLADYKIAFDKGKPSTNIAKTVEVTVVARYQKS
ncbi:MAG: YceI family protein [Gillisia sp.]|nr:YceI family protein [Gillisia sp.]